MHYLSADCIIPVTGDVCYKSVLAVADDGTIDMIYPKSKFKSPSYKIQHFTGILCPGFINTHCHLELSWAKGLISEGKGLDTFVRKLELLRKSASGSYIQMAIEKAAHEMEQSGIVATADISNGDHTLEFKQKSNHYFQTFIEVFGSNPAFALTIFKKALALKSQFAKQQLSGEVSIVPHATYSLSDDLFKLVANSAKGNLLSIHHQENSDENQFFMDGSGAIAERRNTFNPDLTPYSGTGKHPMESIADYFKPDQKLLLVHNTVSEQQDIEFVEQYFSHAYWCLCPNANLFIENRLPDINLFRKNGCMITLGTDSLASNHQLSILDEIKTIQRHFPEITLSELLRWGTLNGASFLGLDQKLGSFETGKIPGVVLIENTDIHTLTLNPNSSSRLLITAGL